jgi:prevent-host-death family protein
MMWTILDHMRQTPLVKAKAHLSELVDAAEQRGQCIIILRHGKPAAAIVPVKVAQESTKPRLMTRARAEAFLDEMARSGPRSDMTIDEALGRNRLDAPD